jgi:hypothetical protein
MGGNWRFPPVPPALRAAMFVIADMMAADRL